MCRVAQIEPGLLRRQNLHSQGGGVPTPGAIDQLDDLLPEQGRRRETQPSGPFQPPEAGARGCSGRLLAELLRVASRGRGLCWCGGEPSFSGGLRVIFRRTGEELLGPPASWGTSLKSHLTHRPFRRAGLAPVGTTEP